MKKVLILSLFALISLVSQAWGAEAWVACTGANSGYCKWTACNVINTCTGGAEGSDCAKQGTDCAEIYQNCLKNSTSHTVWSDDACSVVKERGAIEDCGGYCIWNDPTPRNCVAIQTAPNDPTPITSCPAAKTNCLNHSPDHAIYSNNTCTTVSETLPSSSTAAPITPSSSSTPATTTSSSSEAAAVTSSSSVIGGTSSSSGAATSSPSGTSSSSSSESGTDPIISYNRAPVFGLSVINFARNLQIASDKNATISLFDINGKQVLSQKVLKGTTTISLEKQKVGVYYAIAKSDSQKQLVKIVLK